jgi:hypothetical protein
MYPKLAPFFYNERVESIRNSALLERGSIDTTLTSLGCLIGQVRFVRYSHSSTTRFEMRTDSLIGLFTLSGINPCQHQFLRDI